MARTNTTIYISGISASDLAEDTIRLIQHNQTYKYTKSTFLILNFITDGAEYEVAKLSISS